MRDWIELYAAFGLGFAFICELSLVLPPGVYDPFARRLFHFVTKLSAVAWVCSLIVMTVVYGWKVSLVVEMFFVSVGLLAILLGVVSLVLWLFDTSGRRRKRRRHMRFFRPRDLKEHVYGEPSDFVIAFGVELLAIGVVACLIALVVGANFDVP